MKRPKHRGCGPARVSSYRMTFRPKHCAGDTCFHDHHGDKRPPLPLWRPERVS